MAHEASNIDTLTIRNDPKQLGEVREFVARMVGASPLSKADENKLVLAVDEAVTNIIEHAYDEGQTGKIEIEIRYSEDFFQIQIRDEGRFFNPELAPDPDVMQNLKLGRKHGLGIFLMRQIMDEVRYRFRDGIQNELTLVKRIKKDAEV